MGNDQHGLANRGIPKLELLLRQAQTLCPMEKGEMFWEYLENREWGLAWDELFEAAEKRHVVRDFWLMLADAARRMGMADKQASANQAAAETAPLASAIA